MDWDATVQLYDKQAPRCDVHNKAATEVSLFFFFIIYYFFILKQEKTEKKKERL